MIRAGVSYALVVLQAALFCVSSAVEAPSDTARSSSGSVSAWSKSGNQTDCLTARSACLSELTCQISLDSVERHCGNADGVCNASKLTHCQSVLKTLENRSPFRNCYCEDESTEEEKAACGHFRRLVLSHPCSPSVSVATVVTNASSGISPTSITSSVAAIDRKNVSASSESKLTPASASQKVSGNCAAARKLCAADRECNVYLEEFKQFCRHKTGCSSGNTDANAAACFRAADNLRLRSSLFTCECRNTNANATATASRESSNVNVKVKRVRRRKDAESADRPDRCEAVQEKHQSNACLLDAAYYTRINNQVTAGNLACSLEQPNFPTTFDSNNCVNNSQQIGNDCYDVVTRCDKNVVCRTQLAKLIAACRISRVPRSAESPTDEAIKRGRRVDSRSSKKRDARDAQDRCEMATCQKAAIAFYNSLDNQLAKQAASCRCDTKQGEGDRLNCVKHLDYFRPPCLFRPPVHESPSCLALVDDECIDTGLVITPVNRTSVSGSVNVMRGERPGCQQRWQNFLQACERANRSAQFAADDSRCVRGAETCQDAILQLIGLPIFTKRCSCDGVTDARLKTRCANVQKNLFGNDCVQQAIGIENGIASGTTAKSPPNSNQNNKLLGVTSLAANDPVGALSHATMSTGYQGVTQERYPRDFCSQLQRYNRLSNTHRIYMYVNGSECSELCNCSSDGSYFCRNLTCTRPTSAANSRAGDAASHLACNDTRTDSGILLSNQYQHCVCNGGELVCAPVATNAPTVTMVTTRPVAASEATNRSGLFLHVGYSVSEQRMLEDNQVRVDYQSLVRKLTQLLNGETGIKACDLQLETATDGSVVFEVKITGKRDESDQSGRKTVQDDASHKVCYYPAQLLSHFINLRHPAVSHDAELSMFRSAAVQSLQVPDNYNDVESDDYSLAVETSEDKVSMATASLNRFKKGFRKNGAENDAAVEDRETENLRNSCGKILSHNLTIFATCFILILSHCHFL